MSTMFEGHAPLAVASLTLGSAVAGAVTDAFGLTVGAASWGGAPLFDVHPAMATVAEIAKIRFTGLAYATNVTATTLRSYARRGRCAYGRED